MRIPHAARARASTSVQSDVPLPCTAKAGSVQAAVTAKPGSIEEVDAQRTRIEALPAKVREIAEDAEAAQPWCAASRYPSSPLLRRFLLRASACAAAASASTQALPRDARAEVLLANASATMCMCNVGTIDSAGMRACMRGAY